MELGGLKRYVDISPAHLWQAVDGLTQNGNGSGLNVAVVEGSKLLKNWSGKGIRTPGPRLGKVFQVIRE